MATLTARASVGSIFASVASVANTITTSANALNTLATRFNGYMTSEAQLQELRAKEKLVQVTATLSVETERTIAEKLSEIQDWVKSSANHAACFTEAQRIAKELRTSYDTKIETEE